jgi:Protein of unknown function (Gmx_para_CXXCG)
MQRICCPIRPGHGRGRRSSPLNVVVPCDPAPDVIFTWMSECLIQESLLRLLENEGITGFSGLPARAEIEGTGKSIQACELAVVGWGGIAPAASGIREVERCTECGHLHYSPLENPEMLIEPKNWDGSDFFMIWPLPRFRFVTERVVKLCRRYGVTGVSFSTNFPPSRSHSGYSPGRLSYYMPKERAHQLGAALGIE